MPGYAVLAHPWWVPLLFVLAVGHAQNICVTLYLHRSATHEGVKFRPAVEHLMRLWLWLTSAVVTREWVAVHRKHHAFADKEGDPHSPAVAGFWGIVLGGVFFYQRAARDPALVEKYGDGCPDDWVERHLYQGKRLLGLALMLVVDIYLFGIVLGPLVWSAMAIWMPIMGNIINGVGHALGYRNFGLHNNHHADPRSAKFKARWFEFDIGWIYIKILSFLKLARVVYARSQNAKEFAAKHYNDKVAKPVAQKLDRAGEELEKAKARIDQAKTEARAALRSPEPGVD
jgi:stearoyl-CoA desaturase (delta-9 desaturase)